MVRFPLFLDLSAKNVLVVGAGTVGRRKIAALLNCAPRQIKIIDPVLADADPNAPEYSFLAHPAVIALSRPFKEDDLEDIFLAFAATSNKALNTNIAELCEKKAILCNCAAPPLVGDCIVPAHFHSEGLSVAVSTQGLSPALAKVLREELEAYVASRYTTALLVLGRLRPLLLNLDLTDRENGGLLRTLARSELGSLLESGDIDAAARLLRGLLPEALHPRIRELLHGF